MLYTIYECLSNVIKLFAPVAPYITEAIFLEMKKAFGLKEESIHMTEWPEHNEKAIDKKLEQEFGTALQIIEKALALRSAVGMGVRWPLASMTVKAEQKLSKELEEIVLRQSNVKKLKFETEKGKFEVALDTKLTEELEQEGYSRELMRTIQETRKKAGLKKEQVISLALELDKELEIAAKKFEKIIKEKVNAKELSINKAKVKHKHIYDEKIKDKKIKISFDVV